MSTPDNPTPPTCSLVIGGVDRTDLLDSTSWTVTQNWSRQGDTASFYIADEHDTNSPTLVVKSLDLIVLTDVTLGVVIFSGLVTMPQFKYMGPNLTQWQLQCADWTYLADRATVFGDFQTQTADQIIKTLVTQANCGITTNNVQVGPTIPRLQVPYLSLSQAWTKICQYSSMLATYGWYVDENRDLHFYNQLQAGVPQAAFSDVSTDFLSGNYTPGFDGNYNTDFIYSWDATSIRNSITVRGANYSNTEIEQWLGDGTQSTWPLTYTPDQANLNGLLEVGGVSKTVSIQTGTSATTDWVVVQDAIGKWTLTPNTDAVPAAAVLIEFAYSFLAPVTALVRDLGSITEFSSLPNGGVFGMYIADSTLQSISAAQQRGRRETNTYALPEERVTFTVPEMYSGHVRAGQLITWKNQFVPDSLNSWNPGINDTFLVVQNRIQGKQAGFRSYSITAVRVSTGGGP